MPAQYASAERRTRGADFRMGVARPLRHGVALGLLLIQLGGCYSYIPVATPQLPAGARVSMDLTDRGRMELTDRVGPGVRRLGGTIVATTDTSLLLSVSTVDFIDVPVPVHWNGERVLVARGLLSEVRERRLSRSRSWLAAGLLVLATVGVSTLALTGFGPDRDGGGGGGGDNQ